MKRAICIFRRSLKCIYPRNRTFVVTLEIYQYKNVEELSKVSLKSENTDRIFLAQVSVTFLPTKSLYQYKVLNPVSGTLDLTSKFPLRGVHE